MFSQAQLILRRTSQVGPEYWTEGQHNIVCRFFLFIVTAISGKVNGAFATTVAVLTSDGINGDLG